MPDAHLGVKRGKGTNYFADIQIFFNAWCFCEWAVFSKKCQNVAKVAYFV